MEEWETNFRSELLPGEELISVVNELIGEFNFVPYRGLIPQIDQPVFLSTILGLTNRRLIVWINDKSFYTSTILSLTERRITNYNPKWPYQAKLIFAGGLGLIVQTEKVDKAHQEKLSSLLVQAFMRFSVHGQETGEIAAITADEERKRRQADD